MVWAAISSVGRVKLCFVSKKMNGSDYRVVLRRGILPFWRRYRGRNLKFMHDGAPIHRAARTTKWLHDHNIELLGWPSCSPDLNIIENVWGIMVRKIYEGNKQYRNVKELKKAIIDAWHTIDQPLLDGLFRSMDNRLFQVINCSGRSTDY